MSNSMKSTGKTVDEAVREALLRMGLRREEVSVTVLQEARGGFLGVGRRDAVVEVAKKSEQRRGRSSRRNDGRRDSRRDGGRDGGRDESRRGRRNNEERQEARGEQGDRRRRDGDDESGNQDGRSRRSRGRRGRGSRRRDEQTVDESQVTASSAATHPAEDQQGDQDSGDRSGSRRRRRPRRRRKPEDGEAVAAEQSNERASEAVAEDRQDQSEDKPRRGRRRDSDRGDRGGRGERREPAAAARVDDEAVAESREPEVKAEATKTPAVATENEAAAAVVSDLVANHRVQPFGAEDAADEAALLTRAATSLMVKAGFQSRVTVTPGEYHQVKMVVDDRSAGVLIGRQGSTVDAVEHIVERIATRTVGERVKMNLDINNYRLRREDGLLGATRRAINEARDTGEPVRMDPAGGRERRIVHLEVEDLDDLVTYTEMGERGKQVVICKPEQVPTEYRDPEVHGPAPTAEPVATVAETETTAPADELVVDENEPTIGELLAAEEAAEKAAAEKAAAAADGGDDDSDEDVEVEIVEMAPEADDNDPTDDTERRTED